MERLVRGSIRMTIEGPRLFIDSQFALLSSACTVYFQNGTAERGA